MVDGCVPAPRFCSFVFGHETRRPSVDAVALKLDRLVAASLADSRRKAVYQRTPDRWSDCAQLRSLALMPYDIKSSQWRHRTKLAQARSLVSHLRLSQSVVTGPGPVGLVHQCIRVGWWLSPAGCLPRRAFHSASLSTESKAALMSRHATFNRRSNSRWSSDKRRKARMASIVDRPATKPDCSGRRVASSSASRTCAKTLPGTESKVIGL